MVQPAFNLLHEPWIIATNLKGQEETLSLTDVLIRSHELKSLSGEMPTQDIAILRLLLGVLYAIYTRKPDYENVGDSKDACIQIWKHIWERKQFPPQDITEYLQAHKEKFWLRHPDRPFYQLADIKKGSDFAASKMIGDLVEGGNKTQLFPIRSGKSKQALAYPEAARWLLYLNSFDDAAAKPTQKGLHSMSVGWLGRLGLVYAAGENLFETLMLNFSLLENDQPWAEGYAAWELDTPATDERKQINVPESGEELYTLQSRRIQLKYEGDKVVGYTLLGGDQFPIEDAFVEPMTMWKLSEGKAGAKDVHLPPSNAARNPAKQLWRDFAPLLVKSETAHPPGVLQWISELEYKNIISAKQIQICTITIKYGNMQSGVEEVWSDALSVNARLLSELGEAWIVRVTALVAQANALVVNLGNLASNIAKAAGATDGQNRRHVAMEQAYAALDMPFRSWLAAIVPGVSNLEDECEKWTNEARKIIKKHGENLVSQAGTQAFVGRVVKGNNREDYYSAPKVYGWFLAGIKKIIGGEDRGKQTS